jgi:hypothetical protein
MSHSETTGEPLPIAQTDIQLNKTCGLCGERLDVIWLYSQPIGLVCRKHVVEWVHADD